MSENCNDCPQRVSEKPYCLSTFFQWAKAKCISVSDIGLNIFCALNKISDAINAYTDRVQEKGYASGIVHFSYDGTTVDPNDVVEVQHAKSPFNYKVLGIGASIKDFGGCGGAYVGNSIIKVKFWDFTSGKQIGDLLTLTSSNLHAKDTDQGNIIDDNIFPGHIYGVKIEYLNDENSTCDLPLIDFFLIVSPVDVITEE